MPETMLDEELVDAITDLKNTVGQNVDKKLADFRAEVLREVRQRTSRPPGALSEPSREPGQMRRLSLPLAENEQLRNWIAAPRSQGSTLALEVKLEQKAVVPITGINGVQSVGAIAGPRLPGIRLYELLPNLPVRSGAVTWTKELTYVPGADVVAEGNLKPATNLTFDEITTTLATLATVTKASLQSLADVPQLQDWVSMRLMQAVLKRAEEYLLNAPVTGLVANQQPLAAGFVPAGTPTALDMVGAAISQLTSQGYTPDVIVLNGVDIAGARLLKTSTGEYLWSDPDSAIGTSAMWTIPICVSPSLAPGTYLVAALAESCVLFERDSMNVSVAYENEDDFIRNLACLRAELRAALAVGVPQGIVGGSLTVTPLAAAAPNGGKK